MTKLNKQTYLTAKGEKRINCYKLTLSKEIIKKANLTGDEELKIEVKNNLIIVSKK